jgi:hypothetical protein
MVEESSSSYLSLPMVEESSSSSYLVHPMVEESEAFLLVVEESEALLLVVEESVGVSHPRVYRALSCLRQRDP